MEWFGEGMREICVAVKGWTARGKKVPQSQHMQHIFQIHTYEKYEIFNDFTSPP